MNVHRSFYDGGVFVVGLFYILYRVIYKIIIPTLAAATDERLRLTLFGTDHPGSPYGRLYNGEQQVL